MFSRLLGRSPKPFITVVSGLPRSGTSMMMKMLEAGGIAPIQDGIRAADADNPKGYYEYERVKKLSKGDTTWLAGADYQSVKIISALLQYLPADYHYRVLFMQRPMDEIIASQTKMLQHRAEPNPTDEQEMGDLLATHLQQVITWAEGHKTMRLKTVDYPQLVLHPMKQLLLINRFLAERLDVEKMATIADRSLHRNRHTK